MKRCFDFFFSALGLLCLWPLIFFGWIAATISTKSNGFFIQNRVGRFGKKFNVIKLKTMSNSIENVSSVTALNETRITEVGRILRKTKLDELPQLINVLVGQMSFVGPRPDVAGFADLLEGEERKVLNLRPGITGNATLAFKNEEELLRCVDDPERFNKEILFPLKTKINLNYYEHQSLKLDVGLILQTVTGNAYLVDNILYITSPLDCKKLLEDYKC